jgi:hypothetical protein
MMFTIPNLPSISIRNYLRFCPVLLAGLTLGLLPLGAADILKSNFESSTTADNPWGGVNSAGHLTVIPGSQPVVNNEGKTEATAFPPSVAVGDLNGDGLPDLIVGDGKGFVWFYPNSGTPTVPKFTFGEIMPIWLGATPNDMDYGEGGEDNVIAKVAVVDVNGDGKKPDLLVGNYTGRLFYLKNIGSAGNPQFRCTPGLLPGMVVNTRRDGLLWCNFLAPCLYNWFGSGVPDMLMGDGSYSANSIFLFRNKGSAGQPVFNEDFMTKIIPGMGREQLTPQVLDWNGDGKPDVITGDRLGHLTLFLNTSTDDKNITFDAGSLVKIGGQDTFGAMTSVTVCDLTNNKLPNLIVTNNQGDISYALNTGKPGAPQFATLQPILGKNPFPQILRPIGWGSYDPNDPSGLSNLIWGGRKSNVNPGAGAHSGIPFGVPYELLVCTNAKAEPDFKPPPNTTFKNALKFYVLPNKNTYFPQTYYPINDQLFDDEHSFLYQSPVALKEGTSYDVSFWIKGTGGIQDLKYHAGCDFMNNTPDYEHVDIGDSLSLSSGWTKYSGTIQWSWQKDNNRHKHANEARDMAFWFDFHGQGTLYLDDITIAPSSNP